MPTLNLSQDDARSLFETLEKQRQDNLTRFWPQGSVSPDFDIVCRNRKGNRFSYRYEFVDKTMTVGENNSNPVYKIAGTLTPETMKARGAIGKQGISKQRLIKYQQHSAHYPVSLVIAEYTGAVQENALHMKYPTIIANNSYLTMRELPGESLDTILHNDYATPGKQLTYLQRFQLSIALVEALRDQVSRHGVIHRDIKPANIMVEFLPDGTPRVYIIDYGFSVKAAHLDSFLAGSFGYFAPEILKKCPDLQSTATDIYPMACVLLEVWRMPSNITLNFELNQQKGKLLNLRRSLRRLFSGITGIDPLIQKNIRIILSAMLDTEPKNRPQPDEIIEAFKTVLAYESTEEVDNSSVAESSSSVALAPSPEILKSPSGSFTFFSEPVCSSSTIEYGKPPCPN